MVWRRKERCSYDDAHTTAQLQAAEALVTNPLLVTFAARER